MNNLDEQFDKELESVACESIGVCCDFDMDAVKFFIKEHYTPKSELLEKLEGMRKDLKESLERFEDEDMGYNKCLNDLKNHITND